MTTDVATAMPVLVCLKLHEWGRMLWELIGSIPFRTARPTSGLRAAALTTPALAISLESRHVSWLRETAATYNCGSVNKTLRDLVEFYTRVDIRELDEIVLRDSHRGQPLDASRESSGVSEDPQGRSSGKEYHPHLSKGHSLWIQKSSLAYGLESSDFVGRLIQFAIDELDDELLFNNISTMARSTTDLYSDINI
jgi:hypothetical protein